MTKPLCIPQKNKEHKNEGQGHTVYITGWGLDDEFNTRVEDSLKEGAIQTFAGNYCKTFYETFSDHHLCAGQPVSFSMLT